MRHGGSLIKSLPVRCDCILTGFPVQTAVWLAGHERAVDGKECKLSLKQLYSVHTIICHDKQCL